ncbi:MAG: hypothetical protein GY820_29035 [Gammaproteobacteria bacterium]|nr:hypothetical protein [Gammaproteobacteria bacterium]
MHSLRWHGGGVRPFQCAVCKKRFFCKEDLKVHYRIHSESKPFSCPHCEYKSSQKSNVRGHIRLIHPQHGE